MKKAGFLTLLFLLRAVDTGQRRADNIRPRTGIACPYIIAPTLDTPRKDASRRTCGVQAPVFTPKSVKNAEKAVFFAKKSRKVLEIFLYI